MLDIKLILIKEIWTHHFPMDGVASTLPQDVATLVEDSSEWFHITLGFLCSVFKVLKNNIYIIIPYLLKQ